MLCHKKAIEGIAWYLLGIMDKGVIYDPGSSRGPECCVYVDFPGDLILGDHNIHEYAFSRMDFVTMYAGCPITGPASVEPKLHNAPQKLSTRPHSKPCARLTSF